VGDLASRFGASGDLTAPVVFNLLRRHLEENPEIYGAAFAFAPVERDSALIKSSPYVFRSGGDAAGFVEKDLAASYDYTAEAWYAEPVKKGKALWSAPYFDAGGGEIWMVTYSVPVYDAESRLVGVVTSDLRAEHAHGGEAEGHGEVPPEPRAGEDGPIKRISSGAATASR
jgi:hypothetical protein